MRVYLSLILAALPCVSVLAEEEVTLRGTLQEKPATAKPEVVAILKGQKKGRLFELVASGDVAARLTALAKEQAAVTLSGLETPTGITVRSIVSPKAPVTETVPAPPPATSATAEPAKAAGTTATKDAKAESKDTKKESGGLGGLLERAKEALGPGASAQSVGDMVLSNDEIRAGLREAIAKGVKSAIAELGKADGYFKNADVKIPLPAELARLEEAVRLAQRGQMVDDFVLSMNRAAEQAAPHVADIFAEAIAAMTIEDARGILNGPPDAATQYFRKSSDAKLLEKVSPVVKQATDNVGVTANYKKLQERAGGLTKFLTKEDLNLDNYVTRKGVDGLYFMIAREEKNIRENPTARGTDLLKKIFGAADKK